MNIQRREDLDEFYTHRDTDGNLEYNHKFVEVKRYYSVGYSKMFVCKAMADGRNGIKKGDKAYFKINSVKGINAMGRTMQSNGSCEDVAEVLAFYLLKNLSEKLGNSAVLVGTPYDFATYADSSLSMGSTDNFFMLDDCTVYGCISKNALGNKGDILHGNLILKYDSEIKDPMSFSVNNLFRYNKALLEMQKGYKERNIECFLDPASVRNLANLMFFDYFYADSDRHCKNICFESVVLNEGVILIKPISVLDNGGGLGLQSSNCYEFYLKQSEELKKSGKFKTSTNPFNYTYGLSASKECFLDKNIADIFDSLSYAEQLVTLVSQNKILFNDLKNMYNELDLHQSLFQMKSELGFPVNLKGTLDDETDFLPNFEFVANAAFDYKKRELSKAMAKLLGVEFDEAAFDADKTFYLNRFEKFVTPDALTIKIASDEERLEFEKKIGKLAENQNAKKEF